MTKKKIRLPFKRLKIILRASTHYTYNLRTFPDHHAHQIPLYNLPTINGGHTDLPGFTQEIFQNLRECDVTKPRMANGRDAVGGCGRDSGNFSNGSNLRVPSTMGGERGDARNCRSARRSARDCHESARIPASPRLPRSTPCLHPPRFLHDRSITLRSPYRLNLASFHLRTAFRITRNRTIVLVARQDASNIAYNVCVLACASCG